MNWAQAASLRQRSPDRTPYQIINVADLEGTGLEAINDHGRHVSIRPENDPEYIKLKDWAKDRDIYIQKGNSLTEEETHEYTKTLQKKSTSCKNKS